MLIKPNGGITEGFEFQMDEDTEINKSCSAMLKGELFVFGGKNGIKRKQVQALNYNLWSISYRL